MDIRLSTNIRKYYVFSILTNLWFPIPVFVIFLLANGLSFTQAMLILSAMSVAILLFEIPSGIFADVRGRKPSLVIGVTLDLLAASLFILGHSIEVFLLGGFMYGLSFSFYSGAGSALVYDTLKSLKKEYEYKKIIGHAMFLKLIAIAVASIVGGLLASINLRLPFFAVIFFLVPALIISVTFIEPPRRVLAAKKILSLRSSFSKYVTNKIPLVLALVFLALMLITQDLWHFLIQPFMVDLDLSLNMIGIIFAAFAIISAVGAKYSHKYEAIFGMRFSLVSVGLMLTIPVIALGLLNSRLALLVLIPWLLAFGISRPLIEDIINKFTKSEVRAMVLSVGSMGGRLGLVVAAPIAGILADSNGVAYAFIVVGTVTLIIVGLLSLVLVKKLSKNI